MMQQFYSKTTTKHSGFTLIEVMIIMFIVTILSSAFSTNFVDISKQKADILINEMWIIAQATQNYQNTNATLPDNNNGCVGAINTLTTANFLAGISTTTTPWSASSQYSTNCNTSSDSTTMTISVVTNAAWSPYISNILPDATTTGATTTLTVTNLSALPLFNKFLPLNAGVTNNIIPLSASPVSLASGTYIAQGDINLNNNTLFNASPSLVGELTNQPIIVSRLNVGSIAIDVSGGNEANLIDGLQKFASFNSVDSFDGFSINGTGPTDQYNYTRLELLATVAGVYNIRLDGTNSQEYAVVMKTNTSEVITADSSTASITTFTLAQGERIELTAYYRLDDSSDVFSISVITPVSGNTLLGLSDDLIVVGNKSNRLATTDRRYSYFPIFAENGYNLSTTKDNSLAWRYGHAASSTAANFTRGVLLPFDVELIGLSLNASNSIASTITIRAAARHADDNTLNPDGGSRTITLPANNISVSNSFEDKPLAFPVGSMVEFRTIVANSPNNGSARIAAWFRKEIP